MNISKNKENIHFLSLIVGAWHYFGSLFHIIVALLMARHYGRFRFSFCFLLSSFLFIFIAVMSYIYLPITAYVCLPQLLFLERQKWIIDTLLIWLYLLFLFGPLFQVLNCGFRCHWSKLYWENDAQNHQIKRKHMIVKKWICLKNYEFLNWIKIILYYWSIF